MLSSPTFLHGSEIWTIVAKDKFRNTAAETNFMRQNVKFLWRE
jgi:hypothetical protein